jgi:hypothetical protein
VPKDLKQNFIPETLLNWHIDDGTSGKYRSGHFISLSTESFNYKDNLYLTSLLKDKIGITGTRIVPRKYPGSDKTYYYLVISRKDDIISFFDFISESPLEPVILAKNLFPWKFDCNLLKKDLYNPKEQFVETNYYNTYLDLIEKSEMSSSDKKSTLQKLFYWKKQD